MRKRFLLFGITLAAMVTSCYGPNDSVYTEDLDVVYTQKKDGYDFNTKVNCLISDTVTYWDSKGEIHKVPDEVGKGHPDLTLKQAEAIVENIRNSMGVLGWDALTEADIDPADESTFINTAFMNAVISKTTYVGGGYYPGYGYGYWYSWYPVYYTYSTGSVIVNMLEVNKDPQIGDGALTLVWESFLSGYTRSGIDIHYINQGVNQGFRQSQEYLKR